MSKTRWAPPAAALACLLLAASPAWAQSANRAWVSGRGTDFPGCGAPTDPCRSLQYAHDNIVASGGEIDILDPAGYGAISISKPMSIVNDGVGTAGVQAAGPQPAILINTPGATDEVYLRGLTIQGVGGLSVLGIDLRQVGKLEVIGCVIRGFANGIDLEPNTSQPISLVVADTLVLGDTFGLNISDPGAAPIIASVNNVSIDESHVGVQIDDVAGRIELQISDSHIDNSDGWGLYIGGASPAIATSVILLGSTINQTPTAVQLNGNANLWLSHDVAAAAPGFSNVGFTLLGSNNNLFSDGTSHFSSGPLPVWGFQ